jgi:hypothetical protein
LKWGQKHCPNQLIKKKITQLINGKLGKNRYNKPQQNNNKNTPPPNQQTPATYNHETTQRAPRRKEEPQTTQPTEQSSSRQSFPSYVPLSSFAPDNYLLQRVLHLHD